MKIRDRVRGVRRVRAKELAPSPYNWRTHPDRQRDALKGLLATIGYADVLLAREREDGSLELIDGHLRAETTPETKVPVAVLDVTAEEAKTLLLSIDPLAEMATLDPRALALLLAEVGPSGNEAVDAMYAMLADQAAAADAQAAELAHGLSDPDEVPAPPDQATTRAGDVWRLGRHRLMCGDSSLAADLDRLLAGDRVDLVNTDPPYNVKVEPRSNNAIAAGQKASAKPRGHHQKFDVARSGEKKATTKKLRAKDRPLANDFVSEAEFDRLLRAWFGQAARALRPGGSFYIWGGYANCANYPPAMRESGLYFSQAIIWHKLHPVLTRKDFMGDHEWCFYGWREGAGHKFHGPKNVPDVWPIKKVNPQSMVHLTEKPVELATRAIQYSSRAEGVVLDLFGGGGGTLVAAEQTGRRARLMEIDPLYCDVIVERFERFTGQKAERESVAGEKPTGRARRGKRGA